MTGTEHRLEGCASPSGVPTTTDLGDSRAVVGAVWIATGAVHDVQPGVVERPAVAFGVMELGGQRVPLRLSRVASLRRTQLS